LKEMSRPTVSVYDPHRADQEVKTTDVALPAVFTVPIRNDVVQQVHTLMSKNARQPYAVSLKAGHQTPAESWGTGRAVSRIPRVPGGGTARSGQGAFGNMCRGGRMFGPTKVFRKWHKKISKNQRRYAVASAIAATAVPALVMARGHRIDNVPEFPLVLSESVNSVDRTKEAKKIMENCGAMDDIMKAKASRSLRRGAGKTRDRRFVARKGPLVIYDVSEGLAQSFRNLPGVELANVENLSLLDLAPGGHIGRFCIWTRDAFEKLDSLFGTYDEAADRKSGFNLPRTSMTNADLARIINSDEIQSIVRPSSAADAIEIPKAANALTNKAARAALDPNYPAAAKAAAAKSAAGKDKAALKAKRAAAKKFSGRKASFRKAAATEGDVEGIW